MPIYAIILRPMTELLEPKAITNEKLSSISDGIELACSFYNQVEESDNIKEKRDKMRYLGMCLKALQHTFTLELRNTEKP